MLSARPDQPTIDEFARSFADIHNQAVAAFRAGEIDKALAGFTAALHLNPDNAVAHFNRGNAFIKKHDYRRSVDDFSDAIRIDPSLALARMNRGLAYSSLGEFDAALRDLDEAVTIGTERVEALFNRAIVHARRRDLPNALTDYEAAMAREVGAADGSSARGRLTTLLDRYASSKATDLSDEVAHARQLRLVRRSCLDVCDSADALAALARSRD